MQEKPDENHQLRSLFITEILVQSCWLRTEKTQYLAWYQQLCYWTV